MLELPRSRAPWPALLALALASLAMPLRAQQRICLHSGTVPSWTGAGSSWDDPAWASATKILFFETGSPGTALGETWFLRDDGAGDDDWLYVAFVVNADPEIDAFDRAMLYWAQPDGSDLRRLHVQPFPFDASEIPTTGYGPEFPASSAYEKWNGATWDVETDAAWEEHIRVWAEHHIGSGWEWRVHAKIPRSVMPIAPPGVEMRMYANTVVGWADDYLYQLHWPQVTDTGEVAPYELTDATGGIDGGPAVDPSIWGMARTDCSGSVTLTSLDIGSEHPAGASYVSRTSSNVFFARPSNGTTSTFAVGDLSALFELKVYGVPTLGSSDAVEVGTFTNTTAVGAGTQGDIRTSPWNIPPAIDDKIAEHVAEGGTAHPCLKVTLSSPSGTLSKQRNMTFATASRFVDRMVLAVDGLDPRDDGLQQFRIHILQHVRNMPVDAASGPAPGKPRAADGPVHPWWIPEGWSRNLRGTPTIVFHTLRDTSRLLTLDGDQRRVTRPMDPAGYHLRHEGELEGWRQELTAKNAGMERIQASIPHYVVDLQPGQVVDLEVAIEAVEPPKERGICVLFGLVFLLVGGGTIGGLGAYARSRARAVEPCTSQRNALA